MNKFKIKPIEVQVYQKGRCFVCFEPTDNPESYAHFQCCLAYCEHRELNLKELK
jgi:hypothetical protein